MANPTAKRPLFATRRRQVIAWLQRQKANKARQDQTNNFITVDALTFKTSDGNFFVVK